ncbi:DUF3883 domain-containing protein [Gammaproteobacteria bacterium]|nr:DUF3883 domain-containing protein [Gammaproteobacteria bacterium]
MSNPNLHFGTLYASKKFLDTHDNENKPSGYLDSEIAYIPIKEVIKFLEIINLYDPIKEQVIFTNIDPDISADQNIIYNYVKKENPPWLSRFKKGLDLLEDLKESDSEIFRCLELTGIYKTQLDQKAQTFFDMLCVLARMENDEDRFSKNLNLLKIGRKGEEFSWKLEQTSSNSEPVKGYLKNNDLGWDIKTDFIDKLRFVEVKSTNQDIANAVATISRNQIRTATEVTEYGQNDYIFHFWSFYQDKNLLAKLEAKRVLDELSKEKEWEKLEEQKIYFRAFESHFKEVRV